MMFIRIIFALLLYADFAGTFSINFWRIKDRFDKHMKEHAWRDLRQRISTSPDPGPVEHFDDQYLSQPLDHFDSQNEDEYNQRYWVNPTFWINPDGPVFLYIGGEGKLSGFSVETGAHVKNAQKYGALLFAVEHRFYGESLNDDGLELHELKYLSSQQALADIAHFHQVMSVKYNLTHRNKWIAFGGSYPGSLAAWIRIKYPHLIHASVASSAPVKAVVDFTGYNDVVTQSLHQTVIGGSDQCASAVKDAFKKIDDMLKKGHRRQLEDDFMSCSPILSDLDATQFVSELSDVFMGSVQYNHFGNSSRSPNVAWVCKIMTGSGEPYSNLVKLHKNFLQYSDVNCSDYSWKNFITQLSDTAVDRGDPKAMRQWMYQTCAQFGYYQTCEMNTSCPFSYYMSLGPNFDICQSVFNMTSKDVYRHVDFTNTYYGSNIPQGSRIMFVNGLIDPWHVLGVLHNLTTSELALVIPETSHCSDMYTDNPADPPNLRTAREIISRQIGYWLEEKVNSNSTPRPSEILHMSNKRPQYL